MKKILILVETSNNTFNSALVETIEQTWAKDIIDGKYENISVYFYTAMNETLKNESSHKQLGIIDEKCHSIFLPVNDDKFNSWKKTTNTLKTLHNIIDNSDYILKTDSSVYINVRLLNNLVQNLPNNDERIYCGQIIAPKYTIAPYPYSLYPKHNSILLPIKHYKDILLNPKSRSLVTKLDTTKSSEEQIKIKTGLTDHAIGCILNTYYYEQRKDHTLYYQDWNQKKITDIDISDWYKYITIELCCHMKHRIELLKKIHNVVSYQFNEYGVDLNTVINYINSSKTPTIYVDNENGNIEKYTYDEYNTNYDKLLYPEELQKKPDDFEIIIDGYNLSFEEYYNIPHRHLTIETHYHHDSDFNTNIIDNINTNLDDVEEFIRKIENEIGDIDNLLLWDEI